MNEMSGKSTYFAFISHKSTDTRFALKLKKFIESYKLPTDIQLEDDILPFKGKNGQLSPLCTYEVNFSCNPQIGEEYFSPTGIYSKTVSIEYERNETVTDTILYDENGNRTERRKISCIGDGNYTQTRHTVYYEDRSVETVVGRRRDGTVDEYFEITYDGSDKRIGVRLLEGDPTLES